jgi:hypothetical protein
MWTFALVRRPAKPLDHVCGLTHQLVISVLFGLA